MILDDLSSLQASAVFTFANQAGLDMLETTLVALQDIMLEKILDECGRKILLSEFSKIMQQVYINFSKMRVVVLIRTYSVTGSCYCAGFRLFAWGSVRFKYGSTRGLRAGDCVEGSERRGLESLPSFHVHELVFCVVN